MIPDNLNKVKKVWSRTCSNRRIHEGAWWGMGKSGLYEELFNSSGGGWKNLFTKKLQKHLPKGD